VVQDRDINKVSETVVGTTENIKDGNDEIREVLVITVNSLSLLRATSAKFPTFTGIAMH